MGVVRNGVLAHFGVHGIVESSGEVTLARRNKIPEPTKSTAMFVFKTNVLIRPSSSGGCQIKNAITGTKNCAIAVAKSA